jgi:hypothetical protein
MRTRIGGFSAVVALVAAVAMVSAFTASASAATTTCSSNTGTIKLSPGLTETPHVQNVTIKGELSECSGEESTVTSAKYVAQLKTSEAVTCAALKGAAADEGSIVLKLSPHGQGNSAGTFSMPISELPVAIAGTLESGVLAGDTISGTVTESYTGGPTCGVAPEGKKKAKKVNKGTFTGSPVVIS